MDHYDQMLELTKRLRGYYPNSSDIGKLLDELIKDLGTGVPRQKIRRDARSLLEQMDPNSSAYRLISQHVALPMRHKGKKSRAG